MFHFLALCILQINYGYLLPRPLVLSVNYENYSIHHVSLVQTEDVDRTKIKMPKCSYCKRIIFETVLPYR